MILRFLWPPWLLILLLVLLGGICVLALHRARRDGDGTEVAWWRRLGLVVAVLAIGATPAVQAEGVEVTSNVDVYIAVDRTGSMAAEDYGQGVPRLEGVRHDVVAITGAFPGSRYSLIAFDSMAARQLPLTTDARAVESWAETLQQEATLYSAGSAIDRPLEALERALVTGEEQNPQNVRLVFFLSDGENTDGDDSSVDASPDGYRDLARYVDGGAVLGYGTAEGGRMRFYGRLGAADEYIQDNRTGTDAISRIDEDNLRAVAVSLGIDYEHRSEPGSLDGVAAGIDIEMLKEDGRATALFYRDLYWPLVWIVVGLLAWEAYEQLRQLRLMGGLHAHARHT
ncbi:MAG TPA: VWA domain-containing protein [Actinomycetaceae bacterium]|nr:VWA domain-containing protein [Actinomycetaceae bacterium]